MELIIREKTSTICLNMIVKNESHIIENTLEKLCKKIHFDYWVICDTGSTDNTPQIITKFFEKMGIKGELYHDEWTNFAHNRTLALQRAYKKTDLLLVFDADDEIVGDVIMPTQVLYDDYYMKFGSAVGTSYTRVLLINNHKKYKYLSVIHEFITCIDGPTTSTTVEGDYYVVSGRTGSRNMDPDKYLKDALILEKAHTEALKNNDHLFHRYSYYCANSYKDCGRFDDAIKWYKITLSQEKQWDQEKYTACLAIYDCYKALNQEASGFFYLVKAFAYDKERVECLYPLLLHYCCEKMYQIAYNYYMNVKDFFENSYLNADMSRKLFINPDKYNFFVPYYMILIADKVQDFKCVVKMYEIIFIKKSPIFEEWYIGNLFYNLQFFLNYVPKDNHQFIPLANNYINFLFVNGVKSQIFDCLTKDEYRNHGIDVNKYIIKEVTNKPQQFSKNECAISKNILIYTGFSNIEWNHTYMLNNALGGSEKAVAYISKCFPKDYNIFISGQVKNETIDNIQYINQNQLTKLIDSTPFHTVIVSRYIGFYEMFQTCSFYQSFIWAHDTLLLPYGSNLNETHILKKWNNYINGCVCLTEWHKTLFLDKYPELKNKINIINNGLDLESFSSIDTNNKIKNKFIYTSRPERGLNVLLKLWPQIIEQIPDATLIVSTYGSFASNPEEIAMKTLIDATPSIHYLGKLNVEQLYNEMSTAEFWLYPTQWPETSCITALEMLMSKVICLYYPVAGLVDTVGDYGIQIKAGLEIETIVSLTDLKKGIFRKNGREYAETSSWSNRYELWDNLLSFNQNTKYDNIIKERIYELHNIGTIPKNHIDFLKKLSIDFTPKIIYDIGSNVLAWTREAKKIWPTSEIIAFDAIENVEFLYKEHNIKHHIGVLSKEDNSVVRFYENNIHPAGNSYYKEIGHSISNELYPENVYTEKNTHTLSTVVKTQNFLLADLIKIDVQGAELDIIMGGLDVINAAKYLIVELQDTQYNKGAPLADTTIQFLENNNWELIASKFCDNGPDADYCFKNKRYDSNLKWAFLIPSWYLYGVLNDYFDNLKTQYNLIYTKDVEYLKAFNPTRVTFVYEINDTMLSYCNNNNIEVSLLNTEPLTIYNRLQQTIYNCNKINNIKIYDYSKSNIKILNENGFINTEHLPYLITKEENAFLKELNDTTEKIYDFAIISHDNPISCIRRVNVVNFLMVNGYKVHIISNLWKKERDVELAKCKIVLNIHGQYINTPSNIFEHLRCDRLLAAGYNILSEDNYCLDPFYIEKYKDNLQIIKYYDFLNLDTYKNLKCLRNDNKPIKNRYNNKYNTSKIESEYDANNLMLQFGELSNTDKVTHHEYHKYYEPVLKPYYNSRGSIIEIGLGTGVSLPMWKNLFKYAHIYGIDNEYENNNIDQCTIYKGDQSNEEDLNRLKYLLSDKNVFFINDDGSHIPEHQLLTFNTLFPILVEGGIYIIEDIETSYWTRGECYNYKTQYGYKHPNSIIEIFKDATDIMNREFIVDKTNFPNKILHSEYIESVTFARNCIIIKKNYNATREYRFKMFTTI